MIYAFMADHQILSFLIVFIICSTIGKISCRLMRMQVMSKHGYPPEYCDADGDMRFDLDDEKNEV